MLSAVVLTKNEEENLPKCLSSLSFCDEIVVVDDFSSDKTVNIAKKYNTRVFKRRLKDDFSAQRNFGLEKAKGEWILFIDADETVSSKLGLEIRKAIKDDKYDAFYIKRQDIFMGKKMRGGEWGRQYIVRLGRKNAGRWERVVHETWLISGKTEKLYSPLLHSPHPSLKKFVGDINKYSTLHSIENAREGKKSNLPKIMFMPFLKFIYNFCIKRGYADGVRGFIYSVFMSFHSFLSWSKQWESIN